MPSYYEVKHFEKSAERLGLKIGPSPHAIHARSQEPVLFPTSEKWPAYNPDSHMFGGSIESMIAFMRGLETAFEYAEYLGWDRKKAEQKYRAAEAKRRDQQEKRRIMAALKSEKDPGKVQPNWVGGPRAEDC